MLASYTVPSARTAHAAPALALLGPTASGKSAVALALAERFPIEIVSVDSAQVYRGLDIGTAKPSLAERNQVPHHLIDIEDAAAAYSAARFAADCARVVGEIRARARVPLLVGGTMLYWRAWAIGFDDLPAADAAVRARIDDRAHALGWPALHDELARIDPQTAQRLAPNDAQRIQRALEVWHLTGQPMSSLIGRDPPATPMSGKASQADPAQHVISLEPSDRAWLHARIDDRFGSMLERGLIDEVEALHRRPGLSPALPSMRSVGYRQVWEYLDGSTDHATMVARARAASRQLAKRQLTWLRGMHARTVIDCMAPDVTMRVSDALARQLDATTI